MFGPLCRQWTCPHSHWYTLACLAGIGQPTAAWAFGRMEILSGKGIGFVGDWGQKQFSVSHHSIYGTQPLSSPGKLRISEKPRQNNADTAYNIIFVIFVSLSKKIFRVWVQRSMPLDGHFHSRGHGHCVMSRVTLPLFEQQTNWLWPFFLHKEQVDSQNGQCSARERLMPWPCFFSLHPEHPALADVLEGLFGHGSEFFLSQTTSCSGMGTGRQLRWMWMKGEMCPGLHWHVALLKSLDEIIWNPCKFYVGSLWKGSLLECLYNGAQWSSGPWPWVLHMTHQSYSYIWL